MKTKIAQHTPGPWEIEGKAEPLPEGWAHRSIRAILANGDKRLIGAIYKWEIDGEANARLIAAAPELLEAAKHALAWMDDTYGKFPAESEAGSTSAMLRAAIAKAEAR